jgi:hypothetical protein
MTSDGFSGRSTVSIIPMACSTALARAAIGLLPN